MNNILDDMKKNLRWIVCAFLGVFHFVLLAMPYLTAYMKYDGDKRTESINGYDALSFDNMKGLEAGEFVAFMQIVVLIVDIALLLVGAYLLVKFFLGDMISSKVNFELPESLGALNIKALCNIIYLVYGVANIVLFVSNIIVSLCNHESFMGAEAGLYPTIGSYLMLILSVGSFIALSVIEKKYPELLAGGDARKFV